MCILDTHQGLACLLVWKMLSSSWLTCTRNDAGRDCELLHALLLVSCASNAQCPVICVYVISMRAKQSERKKVAEVSLPYAGSVDDQPTYTEQQYRKKKAWKNGKLSYYTPTRYTYTLTATYYCQAQRHALSVQPMTQSRSFALRVCKQDLACSASMAEAPAGSSTSPHVRDTHIVQSLAHTPFSSASRAGPESMCPYSIRLSKLLTATRV